MKQQKCPSQTRHPNNSDYVEMYINLKTWITLIYCFCFWEEAREEETRLDY